MVALIFHAMFILSTQMFPAPATQQGGLFFLVSYNATAIAVVAIWGPRRMVRKEGNIPRARLTNEEFGEFLELQNPA